MGEVTLCGIVQSSPDVQDRNEAFIAHIAYPGVEGRGADRTKAIQSAVQRFVTLYGGPARDGVAPALVEQADPYALASDHHIDLGQRQRWVLDSTDTVDVPGGTIELVFYRPGSAVQEVSHRRQED